jgi:hypothetical protein
MKISQFFVAMFLVAGAGSAQAGGQMGAIGLGTEFQLSGLGGPSLVFDGGKFHAGGFLAFFDPPMAYNTVFELGGEFYYHVHSTATADFGLGGSIGLQNVEHPPVGPGRNATWDSNLYLEPGFQIRAFVTSNVALSVSGGITIGLMDANSTAITGQSISSNIQIAGATVGITGGAGIHYYFF